MTEAKTESGKLLDGIPFKGSIHTDFEIRLPVLRDTGQALEDAEDKYGEVTGWASDAFYRAAVMASTLVRLGDIPAGELTAELLHENLTSDDYDLLVKAREKLKEKRNGGKPGSPDSDSPSSPSDDTAFPKTA